MTKVLFVSLFAGLAMNAPAQTLLDIKVSYDGSFWWDTMPIGVTTDRVLVRATVSWMGPETPAGFASLTWQPTFRGIRPGVDSIAPFANQGNNTNGGGVILDQTPFNGPFGRVQPFAATGPVGTSSYATHLHTNGSGGAPAFSNYFRIARNDITNWTGVGATSGTSAVNNFNGAGGIACVQKAIPGAGDPPRNFNTVNVTIFQIALDLGPMDPYIWEIVIDAPQEGMSRNSTTGAREASWFADASDQFGRLKGAVIVDGARLVIPAPASVLALGLIAAPRQRRRRA